MSKVLGLSSLGNGSRFDGRTQDAADTGSGNGQTPRDIVEEMAAALARLAPAQAAGPSQFQSPAANVPAPLPINDFEDDFPEDGPVQLPSAWLKAPKSSRSHWLHEQTRAAGFGLALGLAVVVPLVLILTGTIGDHGRFDLTAGAKSSTGKAVLAAHTANLAPTTKIVDDAQSSALSKPRLVPTTPVTIALPAAEPPPQPVEARVTDAKPMETVAALAPAPVPLAPAPAAPRDERAELVSQAATRIAAGDITAARELLGRAAASGDGAATLALAETFDPNMLAAWGAKGAMPDVGTARRLYRYAVTAGVPRAQLRLDALD